MKNVWRIEVCRFHATGINFFQHRLFLFGNGFVEPSSSTVLENTNWDEELILQTHFASLSYSDHENYCRVALYMFPYWVRFCRGEVHHFLKHFRVTTNYCGRKNWATIGWIKLIVWNSVGSELHLIFHCLCAILRFAAISNLQKLHLILYHRLWGVQWKKRNRSKTLFCESKTILKQVLQFRLVMPLAGTIHHKCDT